MYEDWYTANDKQKIAVAIAAWDFFRLQDPSGLKQLITSDKKNTYINYTYFHRHRQIAKNLAKVVKQFRQDTEDVNILVAPGSIGCEAFGYLLACQNEDVLDKVCVTSVDISVPVQEIARVGLYYHGHSSTKGFSRFALDPNFSPKLSKYVRLSSLYRNRLLVPPPSCITSFADAAKDEATRFDLTTCFNLLTHLKKDVDKKLRILDALARVTSGAIIIDDSLFDESTTIGFGVKRRFAEHGFYPLAANELSALGAVVQNTIGYNVYVRAGSRMEAYARGTAVAPRVLHV